jgi:hypothetical protein
MNHEADRDIAEALLLRAKTMSRQVESAPMAKKPREELGPSAFVQRLILRRLFVSRKGEPCASPSGEFHIPNSNRIEGLNGPLRKTRT